MKCGILNENSSMLCYKRLWHISRQRVEKLVNDGVLKILDFSDFDICIDCIKGKQSKSTKKCATRSLGLLEVIHTNICGPSPNACIDCEQYFSSLLIISQDMDMSIY